MSEQSSTASGDVSDPSPPASPTTTHSRHKPVFHPTASRLVSITLRSTTAIDPADRRKFRALYPDARAVLRHWSLDRINMELLERGLHISRRGEDYGPVESNGKRLLAHFDYVAIQLHWQEFYRRRQAAGIVTPYLDAPHDAVNSGSEPEPVDQELASGSSQPEDEAQDSSAPTRTASRRHQKPPHQAETAAHGV